MSGFLSELNIWDRQLTDQEIESMGSCQTFPRGNLVSWRTENLLLKNPGPTLKIENVGDMKSFCNRRQYFIVPTNVDLNSANDQCKTFGGHIATPQTLQENDELLRLVKTFPECLSKNENIFLSNPLTTFVDNNNSIAWIGIEKLINTKVWAVVDSTTETAKFININEKILASLEDDNTADFCVTLKESGDWNTYRDCRSVTNNILACNVCQFPRTPMFTLRGSCNGAGPNWNYYLVQDRTRDIGYYLEEHTDTSTLTFQFQQPVRAFLPL